MLTSSLLASTDDPEALIRSYFLEKLPNAPKELFTCLDLSWLLGLPQAAAGVTAPPTPRETPLALPDGLMVEEYQLISSPTIEPLRFRPLTGTQEQVLARRQPYRWQRFIWANYFHNNQAFSIYQPFNGVVLSATERHDQPDRDGWVILSRDGEEIYRIAVGPAGVNPGLRSLAVFDDHWMLETVYRSNQPNGEWGEYIGHVSWDGVDLNEVFGYESSFGLQNMAHKPFYFFKKDSKIGFSFDGHDVETGYDIIPFYGCCSGAELNPRSRPNLVSFFAKRDAVWYYVEIGVYQ
jgi:hypothetical protein